MIKDILTDKYFIKYALNFLDDKDEKNYWTDKGISEENLRDLLLSVAIYMAGQFRNEAEKLKK